MHINWQQFGLKANPYDTFPLTEGGELSLTDAFVGRESEKNILNNLFESENNACLAVCGNPGVGKTSLVNFQKFIWKNNPKKMLFSCRREIEASDTLLNKQSFLLEIIGSVLREIELIEPLLLKNALLEKLKSLVDFTQTITISGGISADIAGFGGGLDFSKDKSKWMPIQMTNASLEQHFMQLLHFVTTEKIGGKNYDGLIVHVNNFDVVLRDANNVKKVRTFFHEMRDVLQTKKIYCFFLGPIDFYGQVIVSEDRVKSIFVRTPLIVKPLSKTDVVRAFEKRMELLKSNDVDRYIKIIPEEAVFKLYDIYNGDIRSIMTAIKDILGQCSDRLLQPLLMNEAMILLGRERWERIESHLKKEQKNVLRFIVEATEKDIFVTAKEIAKSLDKQESNVSSYLKTLKNLQIIEEKKKEGRTIYLGLTTDYQPLKWWLASENEMKKMTDKDPNALF